MAVVMEQKQGNAKFILASVLLHILAVLGIFGLGWISQKEETPPVPVFELVNLPQASHHKAPPPSADVAPTPPADKTMDPQPMEPKPVEPVPPQKNPLPKVDPQKNPEVKPQADPPPDKTPTPTENQTSNTAKPADDWDIDDVVKPNKPGIEADDLPALRAVGDILMDPLMQAYLERLQAEVMSHFTPPDGLKIGNQSKTTIKFTIERSGQCSGIMLQLSSGNATWDRLAMRAVQISRPPPLPAVFKGSALPLMLDFRMRQS